jgi:hypothetical protein
MEIQRILLSTAASGVTAPFYTMDFARIALQISVAALSAPVGVVSVEGTNEVDLLLAGTDPNSLTSWLNLAVTSTVGTNLATGFDGSGSKLALTTASNARAAAAWRVRWARTSGGALDTLTIVVTKAPQ